MTHRAHRKRRLRRKIRNILVALITAFFSGLAVLATVFVFAGRVSVIDLVNQDISYLYIWLDRNHIDISRITIIYEYSDVFARDRIISQSVSPGERLWPYSTLTFYVSKGKYEPLITVPDFTGWDEEMIEAWASSHGLDERIVYEYFYDPYTDDGVFISSSVMAGDTLLPEDTLTVYICDTDFAPAYEIDSFDDYTLDDITEWADKDDVVYEIDYMPSDTVAKGEIINILKDYDPVTSQPFTRIIISSGPDGRNDFKDTSK